MADIKPLEQELAEAFDRTPPTYTLVGRMCPYCLMWSEDDDEACPGSCNESDEIDASPAKRFRIYKQED